jgi:hypothetical protein
MNAVQGSLEKVWKFLEAVATLLVLLEALTNPPSILRLLLPLVGEYASMIYDALIFALLALFGILCFQIGVQHENVPLIKRWFGLKVPQSKLDVLPKPSEKPELRLPFEYKVGSTSATISVSDAPLALTPLVLTLRQFKYREEVRAELKQIYWPLYDVVVRKRIEFKSWNELREPNFHTVKHDLTAIEGQDKAIEVFSTSLNRRNDDLFTPKFEELNEECIMRYADIRKSGFFDPDATHK